MSEEIEWRGYGSLPHERMWMGFVSVDGDVYQRFGVSPLPDVCGVTGWWRLLDCGKEVAVCSSRVAAVGVAESLHHQHKDKTP